MWVAKRPKGTVDFDHNILNLRSGITEDSTNENKNDDFRVGNYFSQV